MDRDLALIDRLERLYPAVVADCLDKVGPATNVMDPQIRPLARGAKVAGRRDRPCVQVDACRRAATTGTGASWRPSTRSARRRDGRLDVPRLLLGRAARDRLALPRRPRDRRRRVHARHPGADRDALPDVRGRDPLRRLARPDRRGRGRCADLVRRRRGRPATSCSATWTASSWSRPRSPRRSSASPRRRSRARTSCERSSQRACRSATPSAPTA